MDGKTLYNYGVKAMGGIADEDRKFFYDCLDAASLDFVRQTRILTAMAAITTVEGRQSYNLPAGFIEPYLKDRSGRFVAKYNDGTYDHWPRITSFEKIYRANYTDSKDVPGRFVVRDKPTGENPVTGMVTAAGTALAGRCTLEDDTAHLSSTVEARDTIHNINDGSDGVVLSVTDDTRLICALFDGTDNDWSESDSYVITPGANYEVYLDAPSGIAGHTLHVPYLCMPSPVYSDYDTWRFSPMSCRAICYEAAWLFNADYEDGLARFENLHNLYLEEIMRVNRETALKRLQGGRYSTRG
jgi:hypothetical protein